VRKAVLVIAGTLISDPVVAAATVTLVLGAATCLQVLLRPYEDEQFNRSELSSLWGAVGIALLAVLLASGAGGESGSVALLAGIMLLALCALLFLTWAWLRNVRGSLAGLWTTLSGRARERWVSARSLSQRLRSLTPRALSRRRTVLASAATPMRSAKAPALTGVGSDGPSITVRRESTRNGIHSRAAPRGAKHEPPFPPSDSPAASRPAQPLRFSPETNLPRSVPRLQGAANSADRASAGVPSRSTGSSVVDDARAVEDKAAALRRRFAAEPVSRSQYPIS